MLSGYATFALAAAIVWGMVYTIDQAVLQTASPLALLVVDAVLTFVVIVPIVVWNPAVLSSALQFSGRTWLLVLVSLSLATLANFLIFSSIHLGTASTASILEIAYPGFVVVFSFLVFRSLPNVWFFVGAAFIFAGASIIIRLA